ncbi:PEP-CTERM sorting domain-containing protein [Verrucomicrobiaceae bacterium N1E253]|uniref:PEP-CTERM sorting domain-containing protein n=1 Tax=Oceaniferula marina TaxID=2748318 RepID=A0A851GHN5_9BACT|nr:PEP-CTERM sorting domain-containing protein [Oceaniferula marina]NWK57298.1 PEP-CTERM sorting domain-containing protein [Oceaniferula marina]
MKNKLKTLAALASLTLSTNAAVVGIDVIDDGNGIATTTGVLDTTSRTWSTVGTASLDGIDDLTITVSGATDSGTGNRNPALTLFKDYQYTVGGTINVTISGLNDLKNYNLAVFMGQWYVSSGSTSFLRGGEATVTTANTTHPSAESTTGDSFDTYLEGVNYVQFDNLTTDGSGNINFTVSNGPEGIGIFNGFEIQSVPEPSSSAMLGLGGLALILYRRK